MPTILKCPNPSCPFQFDASHVPPGAVVACPQCRSQFTLGESVPSAAAVSPSADPPKKRKMIERSTPAARATGASGSVLLAGMAVGAVALLAGGVAFIGYLSGWFQKPDAARDSAAVKYDDYAVAVSPPPAPWARDEPTRAGLGVNLLAFQNPDVPGWLAVDAKKYDLAAKPGDLRPRADERLRRQFDELDEELKTEEATVQGRPAERYEFRGVYRPTGVGCRGEVYAFVAKNYAYWVFAWAPDAEFDKHAEAFAKFRGGLKVSVPAAAAPPPKKAEKSFRTKGGLYVLTDTEGLWAEQPNPTFQDAAADLWLKGTGRSAVTGGASGQKADLVVAVLDPDGDAKTQAQHHILKQVTDGATVDELTGPPAGDAPAGGEVPPADAVTRLRLKYGAEFDAGVNKLATFATVDVGKKRVVAYALCPLPQAGYWEQRLMLIVGTLKAGK